MNSITWKTKAAKQLRKLPLQSQQQIRDEVGAKLTAFPDCSEVKKLTNHEYQYRLRVGRYRVFFNFEGAIRIVSIEEVKKRDEHTY